MSLMLRIQETLGLSKGRPNFGTKYIKQPKKGEDALACVAMLLNYFNENTSISSFRKKYGQFRNITCITRLSELCDMNGLSYQNFNGNYLELKKVNMPCIIRWKMDRYALLLKVSHETYFIFDPDSPRYEYQQYEVECYYCESALIVNSHQKLSHA